MEMETCTICFENFKDSEKVIMRCKHVYHYNCISSWFIFNKSCPVCRDETTNIVVNVPKDYKDLLRDIKALELDNQALRYILSHEMSIEYILSELVGNDEILIQLTITPNNTPPPSRPPTPPIREEDIRNQYYHLISSMTVKQMRQECKRRQIPGYSRLRKDMLVDLLMSSPVSRD
jgi:hypothetical protein